MSMIMYRYRNALVLSLVVILAATLCTPAQATEAEVRAALDYIPADTPIVLVVPNAAHLSKKTADLAKALGIADPSMSIEMGGLKTMSGQVKGIRDDAAMAVAIPDVQALDDMISGKADPDEPPPMLMAFPITDFKALVAGFKGNADDAMPEIRPPGGAPLFALKRGDMAVLATDKALLTKYKQPNDSAKWMQLLGKTGAKCLDSSDLLVIVNVNAIAPALTAKIGGYMDSLHAHMGNRPGNPEMGTAGFRRLTVLSIYGDVANALVRDTSALVFSADLSDKGIGLTRAAQFKRDSYMAKTLGGGWNAGGAADSRNSGGALLRLPDSPYLAAFSMDLKGIDVKTLMRDLGDKFPTADAFGQMLRGLIANTPTVKAAASDYTTTVKAAASALYLSGGKAAGIGNLINSVTVIQTTDPAAYIKTSRQSLEQMSQIFGGGNAPAPAPGDTPAGPSFSAKYTEKAIKIDGVDVDQYQMTMILPPEAMQGPGAIINMLGLTSQSGYICASGDYVIQTMSPDVTLLKQALAAVKANKGLGADKLIAQARADGLPPNPALEIYINANSIASVADMVLGAFGVPQIKLPADLPPLAVGVGFADGGTTERLYAPVPLIKAIKDAVEPFVQPVPQPNRPPGRPVQPPAAPDDE